MTEGLRARTGGEDDHHRLRAEVLGWGAEYARRSGVERRGR